MVASRCGRAQLVFVIDASYSVTEPMIDTQLAIVRTYASHVPDAEIQIVLYRREAKAVFASFVSANPATLRTQLDDARKAGKLALGNGSAMDAGLTLAAQSLAKRTGPRRILVMTDHLLRSSLAEPKVAAVLDGIPSDIVVHVIRPHLDDDDRVTLARDDKDPLALIATKHHGIYTDLRGMPTTLEKLPPTEKLMLPVILENPRLSAWLIAGRSTARVAARRTRRSCHGEPGSHWSAKSTQCVLVNGVGRSVSPGVRRTSPASSPDST